MESANPVSHGQLTGDSGLLQSQGNVLVQSQGNVLAAMPEPTECSKVEARLGAEARGQPCEDAYEREARTKPASTGIGTDRDPRSRNRDPAGQTNA